jgi:hypothetical protein
MHLYEVRPRKDKRGVDLISDALPFGRLWYGEPNAVANGIGYAEHRSRSHHAVIRIYDGSCNVIETHEQAAISKTGERACHPAAFYGTLPSIKTMKKLIWLLPLLIILGAMFVAVEIKGLSPPNEITISYGNLIDTSGRPHSVQLVLHPDGSVSWRDLTRHIR